MSFSNLKLDSKKLSAKFWLCKPDRTVIFPLKEIVSPRLISNIGELDTLTFSFHSKVLRNNKFVENPLLDKVMGNYLVKMEMDKVINYFIITKQSKNFSSSDEIVNVSAFLEPHELTKRKVRSVEEQSKSLRYIAYQLLEESTWTVDFIDGDIDILIRSFDFPNGTTLQAIFELANKFGAIVEFNTSNRTISFKKYENIGINKGVKLREGYALESFNLDIDEDSIITRLVAYGSDGLEFRTLTPNGVNYIQDFSWFMYPFECDDEYNVIKHSKYMSDELCIALVKYNKLLDDVDGQFEQLRANKTASENTLTQLNQTLISRKSELTAYHTALDVLNATYQDDAPNMSEWQQLMSDIGAKESQIEVVEFQITNVESNISNINNQLSQLAITISVNNNFNQSELDELSKFIREEEYSNDSIIDAQDLLDETRLQFSSMRIPNLSINLTIEAFTKFFDTALIDRLGIGDMIELYSKTLKANVIGKIHGFELDFDNKVAGIRITNVQNALSPNEKLAKDIMNSVNTTNTLNLNMYKIRDGENANTLVQQILTGAFDTSKNVLLGGTNDSITMTNRGLYNRDISDPNTYMVINNGILAITPDNGNSVTVAIDKNGVHAKLLVGNLILGNRMAIESDSGILETDGAVTKISDRDGNLKIILGEYDNPTIIGSKKYGMMVYDGGFDLRTTSNNNRGMQFDDNGFRSFNNNGVRTFDLNATTGDINILGSFNIRTNSTTNRGISFDGNGISAYNSSGNRTFYVDTNGNLTATNANITGTINATGGSISGTFYVNGEFIGGTITGSNIQTSSSANTGLKMNTSGLSGYNSFGSRTFYLSNTGTLTATNVNLTGTINATGGTISGDMTVTGTLNGGTINGGVINGAYINTTIDARVGNNLYLGQQGTTALSKTIYFNDGAYIRGGTGWIGKGLTFAGNEADINVGSLRFNNVDNNVGYVASRTNNLRMERNGLAIEFYIGNQQVGYIIME